ncbi:hypothetical protein G6F43_012734 [Rhizopus delemar]|nr:hypothetical protein G6F43_012734 [Rhizopus delemar]
MPCCTSFQSCGGVDVRGTDCFSSYVAQTEIMNNIYKISIHNLHTITKLHILAPQTHPMSYLSSAEILNSYSAITRSLNLDVKQVPEDMVFQAITFLKQGKSVQEMEELASLSKSTVGRLQKSHCSSVMKPNGGQSKVLSVADEHYYVRQLAKNCVPSDVKVSKCLENDIGKNVGVERVYKVLRKSVLGAIEKLNKPLLSAKNIRNKLSWCIAHSNSTVDD